MIFTHFWVILTHLTHKTPYLTLKISNPSNFYPKLRSVNPKLGVDKRCQAPF